MDYYDAKNMQEKCPRRPTQQWRTTGANRKEQTSLPLQISHFFTFQASKILQQSKAEEITTYQRKTALPKSLSHLSNSSSSMIKAANNRKRIAMVMRQGKSMSSKDCTFFFLSLDSDLMAIPFLSISHHYLFMG